MKSIRYVAAAGMACLLAGPVQATPVVSHFPQQNLGLFLAGHFDLVSIRSSFGPRRLAQRTFADFGMTPTTATETELVFDMPGDWYYRLAIVGRRDVNGDGVEDLEACFTDRAQNGGTYASAQGLVITRYEAHGYALALSFSAADHVCRVSTGQP